MSQTRTALVVDDEDPLLRLMTRVLERSGLEALSAATGEEARALFDGHEREIDLVLLDVTMPGGDGAERLLPEFLASRPDLQVIVTSGDALPGGLESVLASCGGQFLRKPFAPKALGRLIEDVAGSTSSTPPSEST